VAPPPPRGTSNGPGRPRTFVARPTPALRCAPRVSAPTSERRAATCGGRIRSRGTDTVASMRALRKLGTPQPRPARAGRPPASSGRAYLHIALPANHRERTMARCPRTHGSTRCDTRRHCMPLASLTGRVPLRAETHSSDDEGAATAPRRAAWEPAVTRSRARVTLLILSLDAPFSRALSGQPCPAAPFVSPASVSGPGSNARLASLEWHQPRQYPPSARRRGHGLWPEPARRRPVRCRGGTRSSRQWPPLTRKLQGPRQTSRTTAWSRRTRVFRVPLTRWIDARVIPVRETARCTGVAPRPLALQVCRSHG
jgi:hypothetical protein